MKLLLPVGADAFVDLLKLLLPVGADASVGPMKHQEVFVKSNGAAVPAGFSTVTPYLVVDDAAAAIDFYTSAFGAIETFRLNMEGGRIGHAEIRIGDSPIMMGEKSSDWEFMRSPTDLGGAAINLYLYLPDADAVFERALQHGADVVMPLENHSDGDRRGGIRDPFGFVWWIASALDPDARERLLEEQETRR